MAVDALELGKALAGTRGQGPLFVRLALALGRLIVRGALPPGAAIPPERDLARMAGVSRVTVRAAILRLEGEGRLERRQGSGTYVRAAATPTQPLLSLADEMRRRGLTPGLRWLARGIHLPLSDEIVALGLAANERVTRLEKVRLADGRPLAIERNSLPATLLPDPEMLADSLYGHLAASGLRPERAVQRISAVNATPRDAAELGVLPGAAILKIERISYLPGGRALEFSRAFYRGDGYDIVAELR